MKTQGYTIHIDEVRRTVSLNDIPAGANKPQDVPGKQIGTEQIDSDSKGQVESEHELRGNVLLADCYSST